MNQHHPTNRKNGDTIFTKIGHIEYDANVQRKCVFPYSNAGESMITFHTNTPLSMSNETVWLRCRSSVKISCVRVIIVIPM